MYAFPLPPLAQEEVLIEHAYEHGQKLFERRKQIAVANAFPASTAARSLPKLTVDVHNNPVAQKAMVRKTEAGVGGRLKFVNVSSNLGEFSHLLGSDSGSDQDGDDSDDECAGESGDEDDESDEDDVVALQLFSIFLMQHNLCR